ncbi:unnamed protein product [Ceutorhynchus assimilis]|uniref:Uncharacterized protein n=1 Tax=Ceutorhynchus assimilis TaxID=467358 RepID=A0A9N9QQ23_9CUCU|nr:unnamed protein product [Ceutorhynchus assimilis]
MGSIGSKFVHNPTKNSTVEIHDEKGIIPHTTPILTPKVSRKTLEKHASDPRSPSKHFARTPLEILSAAADKLSNLAIESDEPSVETPLKHHLILGIDPRSPTLELQRTPIIVDNKPPLNIKDKNLERVKGCALLKSPLQTVSPKLLESNPVTPKIKKDTYKRKSFVLLETNVDFTETDFDTVIRAKYPGEDVETCEDDTRTTDESVSANEEELLVETSHVENANGVDVEENYNPETITSNERQIVEAAMQEAPIVASEEVKEDQNPIEDITNFVANEEVKEDQIPVEDIINEEVKEDQIPVENIINFVANEEVKENQTPIADIINIEKCVQENIPVAEPEPQENIDLLQKEATNSAIIANVTPKKSKSEPITPHSINVTANVEELNKKLTNLIFEDEDLVVFPRVVKLKDQSRTPLAERNSNGNSKVAQKLKVSDKPRKGEYTVNSKIPLFKDKKIKVQCENTPPRNMRVVKSKKPQWDAKDDTMLI